MQASDAILQAYDFSQMVLTSYLSDFTDAELLTRSNPGGNHVAWQLGHLISSEIQLLESIVPGHTITLPEKFAENHSKENIQSDDASDFLTKDEYLTLFANVKNATFKALTTQSAEDLMKPAPDFLQSMCPNVGGVFVLIATHAMMHAGQLVPIRRSLNKPIVI